MSNIIERSVVDVSREKMLQYFKSIIFDRAISDIRDGLKPVHRCIVYDAYESGFLHNKPHVKCAKVVGNVIATKHPHGDASVYGALIRMSQPFSNNNTLIDFHGNNGNIDGSEAAAMRYTECRLSKFAYNNLLDEIKNNAVDFIPNFDNSSEIPTVLPAKLPILLVNGSFGIAGGFSQSVLPHNIKDVVDITIKLLNDPTISVEKVAESLIPDFPTGGIICSKNSIIKAYISGSGSVKIRATTEINGNEITIKDIPYMTNTADIIKSISDKVKDGTIEGISDVKDYTNKRDVNIKIQLKKGYDPSVILNQLYKFTQMEATCIISLVCKNGNDFRVYNIKDIITEFIEFRKKTITRTIHDNYEKCNHNLHIQKGLEIALSDIDTVINIIKKSKNRPEALTKLKTKFKLTDIQCNAILDMRLVNLTNLEIENVRKTIEELIEKLNVLRESLKPESINFRIETELKEIGDKYGYPRRTTVSEIDSEINLEDIIIEEENMVILTSNNYIKRVSGEINTQRRNTKGSSISNSQDNVISDIFVTSNKDHLLCFTNTGRVYDIRVYEIDKYDSIKAKGRRVDSYLPLVEGEYITNIICIPNDKMLDRDSGLVFITKKGFIKKTRMEFFSNIRSTGIISILLKNGDELAAVKYIDTSKKNEMQDVLLCTKNGLAVRYEHTQLPDLKRDTYGNTAISLSDDDEVIGLNIISNEDQMVFFTTKNGFGKLTKIADPTTKKVKDDNGNQVEVLRDDGFPRLKRSSNIKGRIGIDLKKNDEVVSITTIDSLDDDIIMVSNKKILAIKAKELNKPIKRVTYGVHVIVLEDEDYVIKSIRGRNI